MCTSKVLKLTEFGHRISLYIPVHVQARTRVQRVRGVRTNPLPESVVHNV